MININLFVNFYHCDDPIRQKELDFCLKTNSKSGLFNKIINFDGRVTYNDFFKESANYPNDINILANTDIYFNETINLVREMKENECYCITRWEEGEEGILRFKDHHGYNNEAKEKYSQDVWVIKGKSKGVHGAFHLGVPGCDNRICYEFEMAKYKVSNPCETIQCIHRHAEKERKYNIPSGYRERVPQPYKFVEPGDEITNLTTRRKSIR